jgi:hypothetical protein
VSRATSKLSARRRDWPALLQAIGAEEGRITPEARALWLSGKWCDPRPNENRAYLDALMTALDGRDAAPLLRMLDAGMPMSEQLLPVLAEVIRDAQQGLSSGRPAALTAAGDETVREGFELATTHLRMGVGEAHRYLARCMNVSVDTIKRSLKRTERPPASRG